MILLDTHTLLWALLQPDKLSRTAARTLSQSRADVVPLIISCITLVELARLIERRRVLLNVSTRTFLERVEMDFPIRPITTEIAVAAAQLTDPFPGDPADRIIAATALTEGIPLVTADERIRRSGVITTIW